jgi:hypothetical protein
MMYATITSIRLKGPFLFFKLSYLAMKIVGQLKSNPACKMYRSRGYWTLHYTMSLWQDEQSLKEFARSGAHLNGMKRSKELAAELWTYTYPTDQLPDWKTAKELLKKGKPLKF